MKYKIILATALAACNHGSIIPQITSPIGSIGGHTKHYFRIALGESKIPPVCQITGIAGFFIPKHQISEKITAPNNSQMVCGIEPWDPGYNVCAASQDWHPKRNPRNGRFTKCTYDYSKHLLTFNFK